MKIPILPPDINQSDVEFSVVGDKISFGLGAIKGLGEHALAAVVTERTANGPFATIFDLTERVDPKMLTRGTLVPRLAVSPSAVGMSAERVYASPPRYHICDVSGMPACELFG